jgi:hypothetical protein
MHDVDQSKAGIKFGVCLLTGKYLIQIAIELVDQERRWVEDQKKNHAKQVQKPIPVVAVEYPEPGFGKSVVLELRLHLSEVDKHR